MYQQNTAVTELTQEEIQAVSGGVIPLVVVFGASFALGVTSAIGAYAATHAKWSPFDRSQKA